MKFGDFGDLKGKLLVCKGSQQRNGKCDCTFNISLIVTNLRPRYFMIEPLLLDQTGLPSETPIHYDNSY